MAAWAQAKEMISTECTNDRGYDDKLKIEIAEAQILKSRMSSYSVLTQHLSHAKQESYLQTKPEVSEIWRSFQEEALEFRAEIETSFGIFTKDKRLHLQPPQIYLFIYL